MSRRQSGAPAYRPRTRPAAWLNFDLEPVLILAKLRSARAGSNVIAPGPSGLVGALVAVTEMCLDFT
jgi:hypothetical protein